MLYVDYRSGSKDLIKPLQRVMGPALVEETDLEYGDLFFVGRGVGGKPVNIGIEHKRLADIIDCCRSGRFAGDQLPGLTGPKKIYDYSWLLIETPDHGWRADDAGFVATYKGPRHGWKAVPGKMRASEFEKHLLTFAVCGAVQVQQTDSQAASIRFLVNLFRWWTDADLDKHTSHLAVHQPAMLGEVSEFRKAVMAWPGIGLKFSKAVEREFKSVGEAAAASVERWAAIEHDGRRFGFSAAERVVKFLRGE